MSEPRAYYRVTTKRGILAALRKNIDAVKSGLLDQTFDFVEPGPDLVTYLIVRQKWSQELVARMLHVNVSTVRRWCAPVEQSQHSKIPYAEWLLLLILSGKITKPQVNAAD